MWRHRGCPRAVQVTHVPEGLSKADIESLLRHRQWLEPVPPALVGPHRLQRQREFARLVIVWWPLLVCAFLAFVAFTAWHYHHAFTPHDLRLFALTELLCLALGLLGVVWGFQSHRLPGHERWLPWLFGLILAVRLASSLLLHSEALAVNAVHMALLVCVVGALGLHLGLRAVLLGCALGLLGWLSLPWSPRADMAALTLGHYLLTVLVCVFVAAVRQDKDRMAFYQSVLLEMRYTDAAQHTPQACAEPARVRARVHGAHRCQRCICSHVQTHHHGCRPVQGVGGAP